MIWRGWVVIRGLVQRARQWWRPTGLILLYHRVAELEVDPWSLAVTPAHFAEHIEVLKQEYRPVSLSHVTEATSGVRSRPALAITFDDGYADNWQQAVPLLVRGGVPATFFVPAGVVDSGREYWWDELEGLLLHHKPLPEQLSLKIGEDSFNWQLNGRQNSGRLPLYYTLWKCLQPLTAEERERIIAKLRQWTGRLAGARPSHRPLTGEELEALAQAEGMEVGAHTVTHPKLAALPAAEQQLEISQGKKRLEERIGRPVKSFAYPFGRPGDFTAGTVELVRQAGFGLACTNQTGVVNRAADPYRLPRLFVRDCDGEGFAAWLWQKRMEIRDG